MTTMRRLSHLLPMLMLVWLVFFIPWSFL